MRTIEQNAVVEFKCIEISEAIKLVSVIEYLKAKEIDCFLDGLSWEERKSYNRPDVPRITNVKEALDTLYALGFTDSRGERVHLEPVKKEVKPEENTEE